MDVVVGVEEKEYGRKGEKRGSVLRMMEDGNLERKVRFDFAFGGWVVIRGRGVRSCGVGKAREGGQ